MKSFTKLASLLVIVIACTDSHVDPENRVELEQPEQTMYTDPGISFNGRFLEFATPSSFNLALQSANQITDGNVIVSWGKSMGFTSARAIVEQAIKEQSAFLRDAAEKLTSATQGTDLVNQSLSLPVISDHKDLFRYDSDGLVSGLRSFHVGSWALINSERLVKVGGNIMQFNEESLKVIVGGDEAKIKLLESVFETDSARGIYVSAVVNQRTPSTSSGRTYHQQHDIPMGWDDHCLTMTTYLRGDIDLLTWGNPVYGDQICDCGGEMSQRSKECVCYYPIIGYYYWTNYVTHTVAKRIRFGINYQLSNDNHQKHEIKYCIDNQPAVVGHIGTSVKTGYCSDCANLWLTVYDGPTKNFTDASNHCWMHFSDCSPYPASPVIGGSAGWQE